MTDNSDFMSRYLPPENVEQHREHPAPADEVTEEVSLSDLRLPEPGVPQPPQMPPVSRYEFAPPPAQGGRVEAVWPPVPEAAPPASGGAQGAHAQLEPPPPPGPAAQPSFGPPPHGGQPNAVPWPPAPSGAPGAEVSPSSSRLPPRRARSSTSPTRCRRRRGGHRRALTLRNGGRRAPTFGLPTRHPSGMSRSMKS